MNNFVLFLGRCATNTALFLFFLYSATKEHVEDGTDEDEAQATGYFIYLLLLIFNKVFHPQGIDPPYMTANNTKEKATRLDWWIVWEVCRG